MSYYPLVFVGKVAMTEYGRTGMSKVLVESELELMNLGLVGDEQAELKFHGGVDRALCHYPKEHYEYWLAQYPEKAVVLKNITFGENISTLGMTEENVYIGDIYQWGSAIIQVTQPRSPCYKLNDMTGIADFSWQMQQNGRIGWLYRVIKTGVVGQMHPLVLLQRCSDVSVKMATSIAFHNAPSRAEWRRLISAAGLSSSWVATMIKRIETDSVETFNHRLYGK